MDTLSGKYKIESTLGQGAMGKVYLVKDLRNGCYFAAKQCCSQNPKILERIRREFYFLTRIHHPNIVRGIEFLQEKNSYFIVMDYIQGVTIRDVLKKNLFHVDFNKKLEIAIQICSAVAILNKAEIIHRDIKPSNIMLEGNNLVPRLLDLGIAKMESMQSLTQPGKVVGTPKYMSPEQVDGSVADNSDVFSLGVVLYQWFAWMENSPFHDQSKARVFRNILQARLPLLHEFLGEDSPHAKYIAKLLDKALQKDPKKRIPSTEEMYKLLCNCPLASPRQIKAPLSSAQPPTTSASTDPVPIDLEAVEETHKSSKRNIRRVNDEKILDKHVIIIPLLLATLISCGFFWLMSLERTAQPLPQKSQKVFVKNNQQIQETKKTIALKKETDKYIDKPHNNETTPQQTTTLKTKKKIFAAHYKLGSQYMRLKNYQKALRHFTKAMKINRHHADLFKSRGLCFFYLAKYGRAIRDLRKALDLQPNLQGDIQSYITRAKRLQTDKK